MPNSAQPAPACAQFLPPTAGEHLGVVGESIRVLADGAATGGRLFIFEVASPPHNGPPLHRHSLDDEYFYILAGRVKFSCDGREFVAEPGAFVAAPRGSVHTYLNVSPGGAASRMLVIATPPGLETPFRRCHGAGQSGVDPEFVTRTFGEFKLEIVGPPLASRQ